MLYGLLMTLFFSMCFFMVLIIMVQQSKGSLGLGSLGGSAQMLFGGSGGQDLFQKITWACGIIFMIGNLTLAVMKSHELHFSKYVTTPKTFNQPALPTPESATPSNQS